MGIVEQRLQGKSWDDSFHLLETCDPTYAKVIRKNDYYRLKRALVVFEMTGRPLSSYARGPCPDLDNIDWRCFYLTHADRKQLLRHLDQRCERMIEKGLLEEVISLQADGFNKNCQAGRSIGYAEAISFLENLHEHEEADDQVADELFRSFICDFQAQTRQYTRKQEKWFFSRPEFYWIERPSLHGELSADIFDEIVELFEMPRALFVDSKTMARSIEFKYRCRSIEAQKSRKRELRVFQSELTVWSECEQRRTLLNRIKALIHDRSVVNLDK
jgi:tRNA A37 N6-isopentenylltransferase MiaA